MRPALGSAVRRAGWVLIDQALSSITNFGIALVVLRTVPPAEFGAFTVSMGGYFVLLGLGRAVCGEPQVVRHSHLERREWLYAAKSSTGLALVLGSIGGVIVLAVSWVLGGALGDALRAMAPFLPGLLMQDAWRYAFLSAGRPAMAFGNDLAWAAFQVILLAWGLYAGIDSVGALIVVWGGAASLAALLGCAQASLVPHLASGMAWLRVHKDLWPRFGAEFLMGSGSAQFVFFAVGIISGLAVVGTLNASRILLGPFNILALGAVGFAVPEGIRIWGRNPGLLMPLLGGLAGFLASLAFVCGGAVLLLPEALGESVVGELWPAVRQVMPFMTIFVAAAGVSEAARVGLRVLAVPKRSLAARALASPIVVAGAVVGAVMGDARGAAIGLAVSHGIGSWIWWAQLLSAKEEASGSGGAFRSGNPGYYHQT